jgi:hypothetical protein
MSKCIPSSGISTIVVVLSDIKLCFTLTFTRLFSFFPESKIICTLILVQVFAFNLLNNLLMEC